jgi:isocitrate dehydrogenase (NAD+)
MFVRAVQEVAGKYPDIELADVFIDAACAGIVQKPEAYDVMVMPNQYGDIMSDLSSALAGSIGLGGGATFGTRAALFEAVHGTAPDIAGKGIANPIATLWSVVMLLEFFDQNAASEALMGAIEAVTSEGRALTPDLGGKVGTREFTDAVLEKMVVQ